MAGATLLGAVQLEGAACRAAADDSASATNARRSDAFRNPDRGTARQLVVRASPAKKGSAFWCWIHRHGSEVPRVFRGMGSAFIQGQKACERLKRRQGRWGETGAARLWWREGGLDRAPAIWRPVVRPGNPVRHTPHHPSKPSSALDPESQPLAISITVPPGSLSFAADPFVPPTLLQDEQRNQTSD